MPGGQFLHNEWGMGPFYAWDNNYNDKMKMQNVIREKERVLDGKEKRCGKGR